MKARPYEMRQRAASAASTGERILAAAQARYAVQPYELLRLDDVAADAGVTVQTVLRRFGSKAGLIVAVARTGLAEIAETRLAQADSDAAAIVHDLVAHYRRWGALIVKVYGEAPRVEGLPELAAQGRVYHLAWCRNRFAGLLPAGLDEGESERRLAALTVACDASTWRILSEDFSLPDDEIERVVAGLVRPLLAAPGAPGTAPASGPADPPR